LLIKIPRLHLFAIKLLKVDKNLINTLIDFAPRPVQKYGPCPSPARFLTESTARPQTQNLGTVNITRQEAGNERRETKDDFSIEIALRQPFSRECTASEGAFCTFAYSGADSHLNLFRLVYKQHCPRDHIPPGQ